MTFAWPWILLLLPLPWLVRRWVPPLAPGATLQVPTLDDFSAAPTAPAAGGGPAWRGERRIALVVWLLLVAAAARPQWIEDPAWLPVSGRDLMIALDVSASMGTTDLRLDGRPLARLAAARALAAEFVGRRDGDRVGLIVFGNQAYLHTPLTFDLSAVRSALAQTAVGLAGRETALGDAIALAATRLREFGDSEKVLILLTDGASTAGELTLLQAGWLASREGLRVHVLGLGAPPAVDGAADASVAGDEEGLRLLAEQTGGSYHRATDAALLECFYRDLDELEPVERAVAPLRPVRELHPWPLGAAFALVVALTLARVAKGRR